MTSETSAPDAGRPDRLVTASRVAGRLRGWAGVTRSAPRHAADPTRVTIVDTSVASANLGDQIIMDAVDRHLRPLLDGAFVHRVASHEVLRSSGRRLLDSSALAIVGGTNLLGGNMWLERTWRISPADAIARRRFLLMGVGWKTSSPDIDPLSKWMLRRVLSPDGFHAVRDGHTKTQLVAAGVENVLDTGCPTVWDLTADHCAAIPAAKAPAAVLVLNSAADPAGLARRLVEHCARVYDRVYFWPQSPGDHAYVERFGELLTPISPSLEAYDRLLENHEGELDYVGTRLHGGIRALQWRRRAVIVEIDHRASEMAKSVGLPTVAFDDQSAIEAMIERPGPIAIAPDQAAIRRFKDEVVRLVKSS